MHQVLAGTGIAIVNVTDGMSVRSKAMALASNECTSRLQPACQFPILIHVLLGT